MLLLALACVGLLAAIGHKRVRRLEIEGERAREDFELALNLTVSTQVMSFRVGEQIELENPLEPQHTVLMNVPPNRPPAPIIHSTPVKFIEMERREGETRSPETNTTAAGKAEEIVVE